MNSIFINAGADELSAYLDEPDAALIVRPAEFWEDEYLASVGVKEEEIGDLLPWDSVSKKLRFRTGELTIIGGENNCGKSFLVNQFVLGLANQDKKSLVASFEMKPLETLKRMTCQFYKRRSFSEISLADAQEFMKFIKGTVWIYDQIGRVEKRILMAIIRWSKAKLSIDHAWIDSLTMLTGGSEDLGGQKEVIQYLQELAKDLGLGVHLVAHTKKPEKGQTRASKFSISGTADISNLADNVILMSNENNEGDTPPEPGEPDIWIRVVKNRHGEFKGSIPLFKINGTFCLSDNSSMRDPDRGVI